jgi:hypothetical protein
MFQIQFQPMTTDQQDCKRKLRANHAATRAGQDRLKLCK